MSMESTCQYSQCCLANSLFNNTIVAILRDGQALRRLVSKTHSQTTMVTNCLLGEVLTILKTSRSHHS